MSLTQNDMNIFAIFNGWMEYLEILSHLDAMGIFAVIKRITE